MDTFARWFTAGFCLLLLYAGLTPLVAPDPESAVSLAPAYAWFHLGSAAAGLAAALVQGRAASWFLTVFGLVDLYQFAASAAGWFPQNLFRWTKTDDALHLILGAVLTILGSAALRQGLRRHR